jgi:predicted phosphodiesterase
MLVAVISDIHSNLPALEEVFRFVDRKNIDRVCCLGDIIGYGAQPNEVVELVRARCALVVRGNHDLAGVMPKLSAYFPKEGQVAAAWTARILTEQNKQWLAWLPYRKITEFYTLVHSAPAAPTDWIYINSLEKAGEQMKHFTTPICFIGHTHVPSVCGMDLQTFTITKKMRFLVNVGSVGQPRDGNPQLSFGVLDTDAWTYDNVRLDYDVDAAAAAIRKAGLPQSLAERISRGM